MYYVLKEDSHEVVPAQAINAVEWKQMNLHRPDVLIHTHAGPVLVSTAFLAIDHSFGQGPPILWETMVYSEKSTMRRYSTFEEALKGHFEIVEEVCRLST